MQTGRISIGFHHVALKSGDFDRSLAFYTQLGLPVRAAWGEGDGRAAMLALGERGLLELFAGGTPQPGDVQGRAGAFLHLAIGTQDVDTAYQAALEAGAKPHTAPKDVTIPAQPPIQARIAFVEGPDGEVLEFFDEK